MRRILFLTACLAPCLTNAACSSREAPRFSSPSELDLSVCQGTKDPSSPNPPLPSVEDLRGTWHVDAHLQGFLPFPVAMRFDEAGSFFAGRAATVRAAERRLVVRAEYEGRTARLLWSLSPCTLGADRVRGAMVRCAVPLDASAAEVCRTGTFEAVRIRRLVGERDTKALAPIAEIRSFPFAAPDSETANVRVRNDIAYVARFEDGLRIVDLRDPRAPAHLAHVLPREAETLGEIYNDVKLMGTYALLASSRFGLEVFDVRDPRAPVRVASHPQRTPNRTRVNVHSVFVDNRRAYVAETSIGGMRAIDLTRPDAPTDVATVVLPEVSVRDDAFVHDLTFFEDIAFLNYWGLGFVAFDLSAPTPREIGRFTYPRMTSHASAIVRVGARRIALHGDEDYGAHLRIVDVTSPTDPAWMQQIGAFSLRPEVSIHNISVVGTRAYIAWYQDGLRVIDFTDPSRPRQVAYANTWDPAIHPGRSFYEGAIGVDVHAETRRIYLADTHRGLLVFEDPTL